MKITIITLLLLSFGYESIGLITAFFARIDLGISYMILALARLFVLLSAAGYLLCTRSSPRGHD
jgi:hypothetical protein